MLEKLPIKKGYLLIAATIVLLLLSYQLAFKHTIEAWQIHNELQGKLNTSADLSYQPGYLERKSSNIDKLISQYKADTSEFRSNIINTISTIAEKENVKLTEVPVQDVSYHTDHLIIEELGFEGDYFSLLRLAHDLQSTAGVGLLRSEQWRLVKDRTKLDNIKKINLSVFLENVL